jgi:hypothetical protein
MLTYQLTETPTHTLRCEITNGQFTNERAIVVTDVRGERVSTFVSKGFVDDINQCLKLELCRVSGNDDSNYVLIMAPAEPWFETDARMLTVHKKNILPITTERKSPLRPLYIN